jgi:Methyltransferase domain
MLSKIRRKLRQSGVRGFVASTLRYTANRIDSQKDSEASRVFEPKNEFIAWVRFGVPGILAEGNIDAMEYAIAHIPPGKPILEIGSFCGLSTVILSYLLTKYSLSVPFFTCDKWEFEGQQLGAHLGDSLSVTHDQYQSYVKDTFLRTMQTFAADHLPNTVQCFSDDFFQRWSRGQKAVDVFGRSVTLGGDIGFCYIDGNHTYDFAKRDFENTDRVLAPGGFVLLDDSADDSRLFPEVNQLAREVASGIKYELISHAPNYLFRKKWPREANPKPTTKRWLRV